MRRIADFLGISVASELWPGLVEAAGFEAMRRDGATLMGKVATAFREGSDRFFYTGTNQRWRGVFRDEDVDLYEAKVKATFSPSSARWLANGRLAAT